MDNRRIYLDYSATTPLRKEAEHAMRPFAADRFGNPSSLHAFGRDARVALEDSRETILRCLAAPGSSRIVFTGSGTEADNLAVLGFARRHPGGCVIRSEIEHKAVIEATNALQATGYEVRPVPVDRRGVVEIEALDRAWPADGRPTLVSVMWANNETGVVQPVEEISALCRERGAVFHSDAVQAFGKTKLDLSATAVHILALSAHKIGGPKGIGALLVARDVELEPIVYGGGQEGGLRSGTENVAAIAGFAAAAETAVASSEAETDRLRALHRRLESALLESIPDLVVNGGDAPGRLPNVTNASVPGADIEGLLTGLDLEGVAVSSGSACTTGTVSDSHVLRAMGRRGDHARNTVRLSTGWATTAEEIDRVIEVFPAVVKRVRELATRA